MNFFAVSVFVLFLAGMTNVSGQEALDTIFKIEGKIMPVDVIKVTPQFVSFLVPGSTETYTMERKQIQR